jgi:ribosomal silencing factor RsfS
MASKKQHEAFNKQVEKLLVQSGAQTNNTKLTSMYKWQLQTKFGVLILNVFEPCKSSVFSVFGMFADYEQHEEQLKGITNHWKWNIHAYESGQALSELQRRIKTVTI